MGEEGRNIGGWHWEELQALPYIKTKLNELFLELEKPFYQDDKVTIEIKEIKEVKGEASVTNRKRKIAAFYEFDIKMNYECSYPDEGLEKGEIHLVDISDENDLDDFGFKVKSNTSGKEEGRKALLDSKRAKKVVVDKIVELLKGLRSGSGFKFNFGVANTSSNTSSNSSSNTTDKTTNVSKSKPVLSVVESVEEKKSGSTKIELKEEFIAPPGHIYECFVDPRRIQAYTNSKAEVDARVGGKFNLLNGNIEGTFIEIEHNKKIVQKWRFSSWPANQYSTVTMLFDDDKGKTILKLTQTGAPKSEEDRLKSGWYHQFFVRIKGVFQYGVISGSPF